MAKAKKGKVSVKSRKRKEPEGDHVRQLAPVGAVKSYIKEIIATKAATSEAGQGLTTATKRFTDQGGNAPAARIAGRIYAKGMADGLKGRVLWEDVVYYLTECTDFDKVAPAGMFTAEESGQKRRKQEELPVELPQEEPGEPATTHH